MDMERQIDSLRLIRVNNDLLIGCANYEKQNKQQHFKTKTSTNDYLRY